MYNGGKYVVGETIHGAYTAVCFNEVAVHRDFLFLFKEIDGAGFFNVDGEVICYGESVSLKIKSREEDIEWVRRSLGMGGRS